MLQCGGCGVSQAVPILLNPVVWLVVVATASTIFAKATGREKKK